MYSSEKGNSIFLFSFSLRCEIMQLIEKSKQTVSADATEMTRIKLKRHLYYFAVAIVDLHADGLLFERKIIQIESPAITWMVNVKLFAI